LQNKQIFKKVTFKTKVTGFIVKTPYYELRANGQITLFRDYCWNGNTGLPLALESKWLQCMLPGSAGHDALYQILKEKRIPKSYRKEADVFLKDKWIADGTPKAIALSGYATVRAVGWMFI
jgi:hypothetical protein